MITHVYGVWSVWCPKTDAHLKMRLLEESKACLDRLSIGPLCCRQQAVLKIGFSKLASASSDYMN